MSSFTLARTSLRDAVAELRRRTSGAVLVPGDDGYDAARAAWNLAVDQRPAVVVVAADVEDVIAAVRFAREQGRRVGVQATGHGVARPADGAVLVVTARLDKVSIDPARRRAHVSAGAKWGAVLAPAQEHGLAPLLGSSSDVGAVGYTLGGGMGWLARRHGLASDSVVSFDVVTPNGTLVHASATDEPELFWALKGGGGGTFGIVTSMTIELYPVRTVYAGNLFYPIEMATDVMARWREWAAATGDEMTSAVVLMNHPPTDDVPEPLRGRSFVIVRGCWTGDLDAGRQLVDEWRAWRRPVVDQFGPMPFSAVDAISNDPVDPLPAKITSEWFDDLADGAIEAIIEATVPAPNEPPRLIFAEIRHAGGAIRSYAQKAANDRGRSGEFLLEMVGLADDADAGEALEDHLRATRAALAPYVTGAAYLNLTDGHEKQERTPDAYSADHLARLRRVKATVDPDDRFCHGFGLSAAS